jgi:hypothetical protein
MIPPNINRKKIVLRFKVLMIQLLIPTPEEIIMAVKINQIYPAVRHFKIKRITPIFKEEQAAIKNLANDGTHIMQDSHLNFIDKLIFKALDKMSPIMNKSSKLRNNIMKITEKIVRANNDI